MEKQQTAQHARCEQDQRGRLGHLTYRQTHRQGRVESTYFRLVGPRIEPGVVNRDEGGLGAGLVEERDAKSAPGA